LDNLWVTIVSVLIVSPLVVVTLLLVGYTSGTAHWTLRCIISVVVVVLKRPQCAGFHTGSWFHHWCNHTAMEWRGIISLSTHPHFHLSTRLPTGFKCHVPKSVFM